MKTYLPLMTWVEARDAARAGRVALVPVGTTDANGPQLPTGFDHLVAAALAEQAAERTGGVWLPPIAFGVSEALAGFPGTVSVSPQLLGAQIEAVLGSLIAGGFEHVILINNHGPNQYPAEYACREVRRRTGVLVATINPAQLARDLWADLFPGAEIGHGAEPGTSLLMHL
ncbi:creatininase family protein, partial [Streptomyces anulatus]|uniref:creatininase family protein n=1 Tax=Streptomyces anulatus TaxID=1892 RepID=UPI0034198723